MRLLGCTVIGLAVFAAGLTFLTYGIAQAVEIGSCGTDEYGRSVGPPCPDGFGEMIVLTILGAFAAFGGAVVFSARERGSGPLALIGGMGRFFSVALLAAGAAVVLALIDLNAGDTRPGREIVAVVAGLVLLVSVPALLRKAPAPAALPADRSAALAQLSEVLSAGVARAAAAGSTGSATPPADKSGGASAATTAGASAAFGAAHPPGGSSPATTAAGSFASDGSPGSGGAGAPAASDGRSDPSTAQARAEAIAARLRQLDELRETGLLGDDEYADRRRQILSEL